MEQDEAFSKVELKRQNIMELASTRNQEDENSKTLSIGQEKVLIDCGNPRYAASKVPSQVGPLIGQRSRRLVNFSIAENRASRSIDYTKPEFEDNQDSFEQE